MNCVVEACIVRLCGCVVGVCIAGLFYRAV
jgi:hypothetical protein